MGRLRGARFGEARLRPRRRRHRLASFRSQAGHEQAGRRPALVLTPLRYNAARGMMICCPMTTKAKGYVFEVAVDREAAERRSRGPDQEPRLARAPGRPQRRRGTAEPCRGSRQGQSLAHALAAAPGTLDRAPKRVRFDRRRNFGRKRARHVSLSERTGDLGALRSDEARREPRAPDAGRSRSAPAQSLGRSPTPLTSRWRARSGAGGERRKPDAGHPEHRRSARAGGVRPRRSL